VKRIYDKDTDTLSIILRPGKVAEGNEVKMVSILFSVDQCPKNDLTPLHPWIGLAKSRGLSERSGNDLCQVEWS
jgi:hypothetical protein